MIRSRRRAEGFHADVGHAELAVTPVCFLYLPLLRPSRDGLPVRDDYRLDFDLDTELASQSLVTIARWVSPMPPRRV